jgi:Protein of unknown function (DUF1425)
MHVPTWFRAILGSASLLTLAGCAGATGPVALDEGQMPSPPRATPAGFVTPGSTPASLLTQNSNGRPNPVYGSSEESSPAATETASLAAPAMTSGFDNLEIVTPDLKGRVAVLRVGSDRTDSNLLSVFAGVKNRTAHRIEIEMQTVYRDKEGKPLTDGFGGWIPITLKPHEETQYRSVAISENATDFVVRIRHAPGTGQQVLSSH